MDDSDGTVQRSEFSPLAVDHTEYSGSRRDDRTKPAGEIGTRAAPCGRCRRLTLLPGPPHVKNIIFAELCERFDAHTDFAAAVILNPDSSVWFSAGFVSMGTSAACYISLLNT
jgi:hypothetical protein